MSDAPAAPAAPSQSPPHPQHALPVVPKRKNSLDAGKGPEGKKFTLGFLGGGMMASALIRGLIKAEVGGWLAGWPSRFFLCAR